MDATTGQVASRARTSVARALHTRHLQFLSLQDFIFGRWLSAFVGRWIAWIACQIILMRET